MTKLTITEPDPDENGPGLILTAEGQRSELHTAAAALVFAARQAQAYLDHVPFDERAVVRALGRVDTQRQVMRDLLAAEVGG